LSEDKECQWLQFEKLIDLHKFYFENLIKSASFSFGIIGAILTYVISAKLSENLIRLALQLPFLLSIGTFIMFCFGTWKTWDLSNWVKHDQAELGIDWRPHAETLTYMSIAFALLFLIVAIVLEDLLQIPQCYSRRVRSLMWLLLLQRSIFGERTMHIY
jgi:TRAP-type C4-dicarboxylate transport system permease small subunit